MEGKKLKSFIIIEIILVALFGLAIFGITYLFKDAVFWIKIVIILTLLLLFTFCGALNIVLHIKKK